MPFYANKKRDTSTHVVSLNLLAIFFCSQAGKHMVSFLIRTARNSLPPLRLMKTEIQMLQR
nr:hypothetical protein [uncultured Peptostreptococcus sp.]